MRQQAVNRYSVVSNLAMSEPFLDDLQGSAYQDLSVRRYQKLVKSSHRKAPSRFQRVFQSIIIAAVVFLMFQAIRTIVTELYRFTTLTHHLPAVEHYYAQTQQEHEALQDKIKLSTSPAGVESLARNYLNLVSDNEILVRVH